MIYSSLKRKLLHISGIFLVLFFATLGIFFYYSSFKVAQKVQEDQAQKEAALEASKIKENVFVSDVKKIQKEESIVIPSAIPQSENYQMREVVFSGYEPSSMGGEVKDLPLEITDVRSEVLTSKDGKEAKLYVSWKTNKLAISQVVYSKNGQTSILSEDGIGFSHAVIIGKFDFSTRYKYMVKARDRWGNTSQSGEFSVYSGQKTEGVLVLISNEFKKIFDWTNISKR